MSVRVTTNMPNIDIKTREWLGNAIHELEKYYDLRDNIKYHVVLSPYKDMEDAFGITRKKDSDTYLIKIQPDFRDLNDEQDKDMMLRAVAHEMAHVDQIEKGWLDGLNWKGKFYGKRKHKYEDLPWEKDAWNRGDIAYKAIKSKISDR